MGARQYTPGMTSDRISRVATQLLDAAETATILEDWAEAEALSRKVVELDSDDPDAQVLMDFAVQRAGDAVGVEAGGTSVDQAIDEALRQSGFDPDFAEYEVVRYGRKGGFLGIGAENAVIRLYGRQERAWSRPSQLSPRLLGVVEAFLARAEGCIADSDWDQMLRLVEHVLQLDPENADAKALREIALSLDEVELAQPLSRRESATGSPEVTHGGGLRSETKKPYPQLEEREPMVAPSEGVPETATGGATPGTRGRRRPSSAQDASLRPRNRDVTFGAAISLGFSNYAMFDGRSSRAAYWYWMLFSVLVGIVTATLDVVLGSVPALNGLSVIMLFLPSFAVGVRRLHDVNKSGWHLLWGVIPLLGNLYVLSLLVGEGTQGANDYGASAD